MKLWKILSAFIAFFLSLGFIAANVPAALAAVRDTVIVATNEEPSAYITLSAEVPSNQNKDSIVLFQLYDPLFYLDNDSVVQPCLATGYEVSDDGLEYTVRLRDDVYFHNGYKMTAEDVAFTCNTGRAENPTNANALLVNLDRVEVVDEYTVKFILKAPFAGFVNCLTARLAFIFSKQYYEEVGGAVEYNKAPIGTGAYKFDSRVSGESVTLVANENYWGGAPSIKTVIIKPIANISTQFLSLENGELDLIVRADVASSLQLASNQTKWDHTQSSARAYFVFVAREPSSCNDINLRKAIYSAINVEEIILGALEGYGTALPYDCVPSYAGAPDPAKTNSATMPFDLDKAQEYLAASNYKGETLKIIVIAGGSEEKAAQIIQGQLLQIGVNIEIVPLDSATYNTMLTSGEGHDIYLGTNTSSIVDISSINTQYRSNNAKVSAQPANLVPELDRVSLLCDVEQDPEKRKELSAQYLNIIIDNALAVPLYSTIIPVAYNTGLKGVSPHFAGCYLIRDWSWE